MSVLEMALQPTLGLGAEMTRYLGSPSPRVNTKALERRGSPEDGMISEIQ